MRNGCVVYVEVCLFMPMCALDKTGNVCGRKKDQIRECMGKGKRERKWKIKRKK